jgi:hypothetical protein
MSPGVMNAISLQSSRCQRRSCNPVIFELPLVEGRRTVTNREGATLNSAAGALLPARTTDWSRLTGKQDGRFVSVVRGQYIPAIWARTLFCGRSPLQC